MVIKNITVQGFRNLENIDISPDENLNIFFGDNAQGKTNIIEAVWLCTGAKSFRGAKEGDFKGFDKEFYKINLLIDTAVGSKEILISEFDKRIVKLDGVSLPYRSKLAGEFNVVVFSPSHLSLVKDNPSGRRKFLDTLICQLRPNYIKALSKYTKIITQRANLLKNIRAGFADIDSLDEWDILMAEYGKQVLKYRTEFAEKLFLHSEEIYKGISKGNEDIAFKYITNCGDDFLDILKQNRNHDIRLAQNNYGPHRDDIEIFLADKSAKSFGSQGQQRSCVLALKLAEAEIIEEETGEKPVILLDDVMSELDKNRQEFLLGKIKGAQVFITCCDENVIGEIGSHFSIKRGRINVSSSGT